MFQMAEQIRQTCGIMSDNSSLNLFVSRSHFYFANSIYATFYATFFPPIFFHFFADQTSTVLLQYRYWYGNLETFSVVSHRSSTLHFGNHILPVSRKVSTNQGQTASISGSWISDYFLH